MVRIGVTGATGFIGGGLVPRLVEAGYDLLLVDNHTGPVRVDPGSLPVLSGDFFGDRALSYLADSEAILHLGAASGVVACANDPTGTARVNVEGTRRLVAMAAERHIPVLFASSFAVVGSPERLPITEETPPRPTHEYARQKTDGERLVGTLSARGAAPGVVMRMSNVYGAYRSHDRRVEKGNVLSLFIQQAASGRLRVNSPGTQRRNFIHVEDVFAHWLAAVRYVRSHPEPTHHLFNCASEQSFSVLEVADKVVRAWAHAHPGAPKLSVDIVANPRASIELIDPEFSVSRRGTERELGVRCERTVDQMLAESFVALGPKGV